MEIVVANTLTFFAPLGSSDHNSIMWTPNDTFDNRSNTCVKRSVRRYPESGLNDFGLWAGPNEWSHGLGPSPSTNDLVSSFTADINAAVDNFFPANTVRFHPTDKPWITARIKQLVKER